MKLIFLVMLVSFSCLAQPSNPPVNVWVWGDNGDGLTNVSVDLTNAIAISAGARHCLALKADGTVVAWGDNSYGQCNVPAGLGNVVTVSAGDIGSVALRADGTMALWGCTIHIFGPCHGGIVSNCFGNDLT